MKGFFFVLLLFPMTCFSQFVDDFSDGDFTNDPEWVGQTERFLINDSKELQLTAEATTDTSYLSTVSEVITENATWEFLVKLEFNPSNQNYCDIYLTSNTSDLKNVSCGYFVRLGTNDDKVSLYRKDQSSHMKIIDGKNKRLDMNSVVVRIKVTRELSGQWVLMSDTLGGRDYYIEGTTIDNTYLTSSYFGVFCRYTQANSRRFYFDDFKVIDDSYSDNTPK